MHKSEKYLFRNKAIQNKPKKEIFEDNFLQYYATNTFDYKICQDIPENIRAEISERSKKYLPLTLEHANIIAQVVLKWAISKKVSHFCHWFQPLTGKTAEKHDSFLNIKNGKAIAEFKASQLTRGEPDASSFPNGGSRSTFEARGYTAWDTSSPLFILEGENGKTLFIPTAFISYSGEALDVKTPLLRSITKLSQAACSFLNAIGESDVNNVIATCGAEQEYFLIDKNLYFSRPDLVMTGRTLFGALSSKNQQLDDHYFGSIDDRVLAFMNELDLELYRLGIPSKTRHNEVAPGQYELAPIFTEANIAADHNMLIMAMISRVASRHNFVSLLHEKPFQKINGSGKHLNWSIQTNKGENLLEPGKNPENNKRFLSMFAIVLEAVHRHSDILRVAITSAGNDYRLGANEAPPSIISAFTGHNIKHIIDNIVNGDKLEQDKPQFLSGDTHQVVQLLKDKTDRNRTSPFAFTGNKFELRAVGSDSAVGLPLSILNGAVSDIFLEATNFINQKIKEGKSSEDALNMLIAKLFKSSYNVIFNGDGYSKEWLEEAKKRNLPNYRSTPDCLPLLLENSRIEFLTKQEILTKDEIHTRYNVLLDRYITLKNIESTTLEQMINHHIIPFVISYKNILLKNIKLSHEVKTNAKIEIQIIENLNQYSERLVFIVSSMSKKISSFNGTEIELAHIYAKEIEPIKMEISDLCTKLEDLIPDSIWGLPTYSDMLFLR